MEAIQSTYVFVSHKSEDHPAALSIVERLEARGIRCWIDGRDIPLGNRWDHEIGEMLFNAAAIIWVKSPRSLIGDMVHDELSSAREHDQLIIPVEIEPVTYPGSAAWRWQHFDHLQAFRFDNPGWEDRVAERLFKLPAFAATAEGSGSKPSGIPDSTQHAAVIPTLTSLEEHNPLAIIRSDGRTHQLDALNGLGETLIDRGDSFATGNMGDVAISPDASTIATSSDHGPIELWVLGAADSTRGPVLSTILPPEASDPRMLAVDRPLGQATRIIASANHAAYSIMQRLDGEWAAMKLIDGPERIVSGTTVGDDLLVVWAGGTTSWASGRSKRPFSLLKIRGIDAALGADGRYYLAAWGSLDGSRQVEVVVEAANGWERLHRGPGLRVGIVRVLPDIVRQRPGAKETTIAVELEGGSVNTLALPLAEAFDELVASGD